MAVKYPMSHGSLAAEPGVKPLSPPCTPGFYCNQLLPSFQAFYFTHCGIFLSHSSLLTVGIIAHTAQCCHGGYMRTEVECITPCLARCGCRMSGAVTAQPYNLSSDLTLQQECPNTAGLVPGSLPTYVADIDQSRNYFTLSPDGTSEFLSTQNSRHPLPINQRMNHNLFATSAAGLVRAPNLQNMRYLSSRLLTFTVDKREYCVNRHSH